MIAATNITLFISVAFLLISIKATEILHTRENSTNGCLKITDTHKNFDLNKIIEGYWILAYGAPLPAISIFHNNNVGLFDYNFRIINDTTMQIIVSCVKEKDFIKPFKMIITKTTDGTLRSVNVINEEYCGNYFKSKNELNEIQVIDTDYSNYFILYGCVDETEGILVFTKKFRNFENNFYLKIKTSDFLFSKQKLLKPIRHTIERSYVFCVNTDRQKFVEKNCDNIADKKFFSDAAKLDLDLEENIKRSIFRPFRYKLDGMFNYLSDDKGPRISIFLAIILLPIVIKLMEYFFEFL
jgi:hypothetical protein